MVRVKENLNQIIISILLIGIISISGCGQRQTQTGSAEPPSVVTKESKAKSKFNCKDLLPDSDLQRLVPSIKELIFKEESVNDQLTCSYGYKETPAFSLVVGISWGPVTKGFEGSKTFFPDAKDIAGIGSAAYTPQVGPDGQPILGQISVLSSNKKYAINIVGLGIGADVVEDFNIVKEIAKVIDTNLNKH